MSQRILLIYTGGTIGMVRSEQGYIPAPGFKALLRSQQAASLQSDVDFDVIECDQLLDSANLTPNHWTAIAKRILRHYDEYCGFVVLHGTDTMAFTASALSFLLRGLDKPVILTGSQIPLTEQRNDARDNLSAALALAGKNPAHEVCLYFDGRLMRGNRSTKANASGFDAFESPNFPLLSHAGTQTRLDEALRLPPAPRQFVTPRFNDRAVAALQLYPGIHADMVARVLADPQLKGLVLRSYGVGNVPEGNTALMEQLEVAASAGVVIVNTTQCLRGSITQTTYATGMRLNRAGVVGGSDMTFEAAFAKLHYLLAMDHSPGEVRQLMTENLCGEISMRGDQSETDSRAL